MRLDGSQIHIQLARAITRRVLGSGSTPEASIADVGMDIHSPCCGVFVLVGAECEAAERKMK